MYHCYPQRVGNKMLSKCNIQIKRNWKLKLRQHEFKNSIERIEEKLDKLHPKAYKMTKLKMGDFQKEIR